VDGEKQKERRENMGMGGEKEIIQMEGGGVPGGIDKGVRYQAVKVTLKEIECWRRLNVKY